MKKLIVLLYQQRGSFDVQTPFNPKLDNDNMVTLLVIIVSMYLLRRSLQFGVILQFY